ncbi:MAG: DUF167 domain-containing protein [Candidatus Obscuribacterales bacterium]|nr:DUF167 domain-containing protein [Candidatus Obscuribacterales bacterium]
MNAPCKAEANGISLLLHVQPGAARSEFAGLHDDALKLRVSARAVDGEANKSVCAFLSRFFAVSKTCVTIKRGATSRKKTVFIEGDPVALVDRFNSIQLGSTDGAELA